MQKRADYIQKKEQPALCYCSQLFEAGRLHTQIMRSEAVKIPWQTCLSELIGTALLAGVGLSFAILDFGAGSPVVDLLPDAGLHRPITGFLFGMIGAAIAISPVGKISGAHINPVVTLAFHVKGKFSSRNAIGDIVAQFAGAGHRKEAGKYLVTKTEPD